MFDYVVAVLYNAVWRSGTLVVMSDTVCAAIARNKVDASVPGSSGAGKVSSAGHVVYAVSPAQVR